MPPIRHAEKSYSSSHSHFQILTTIVSDPTMHEAFFNLLLLSAHSRSFVKANPIPSTSWQAEQDFLSSFGDSYDGYNGEASVSHDDTHGPCNDVSTDLSLNLQAQAALHHPNEFDQYWQSQEQRSLSQVDLRSHHHQDMQGEVIPFLHPLDPDTSHQDSHSVLLHESSSFRTGSSSNGPLIKIPKDRKKFTAKRSTTEFIYYLGPQRTKEYIDKYRALVDVSPLQAGSRIRYRLTGDLAIKFDSDDSDLITEALQHLAKRSLGSRQELEHLVPFPIRLEKYLKMASTTGVNMVAIALPYFPSAEFSRLFCSDEEIYGPAFRQLCEIYNKVRNERKKELQRQNCIAEGAKRGEAGQ